MIIVKYLASLADKLGKNSDSFRAEADDTTLTVAQIWAQLNPDTSMPANTICAINFDYATPDSVVADGSELAFFPPVTGG